MAQDTIPAPKPKVLHLLESYTKNRKCQVCGKSLRSFDPATEDYTLSRIAFGDPKYLPIMYKGKIRCGRPTNKAPHSTRNKPRIPIRMIRIGSRKHT